MLFALFLPTCRVCSTLIDRPDKAVGLLFGEARGSMTAEFGIVELNRRIQLAYLPLLDQLDAVSGIVSF